MPPNDELPTPNHSLLMRPCFDSYFATSAFKSFSIRLDKLLFSDWAMTRSLLFRLRSIFSEIVVSFIGREECYNVELLTIKEAFDLLSP